MRITALTAARVSCFLFVPIIGFHLLILTGVIPYHIVWGGRLATRSDMLRFELVSVLLNACMLTVVALRMQWLPNRLPAVLVRGLLWAMVLLFTLNSVGNLAAVNAWETVLFTPLTALLALLSYRLTRN